MDKVGQVTMMANTEAIKEPRGFIKFLQVILAIFAFATTTAYNGSTGFKIGCGPNLNESSIIGSTSFSYTFRLDAWRINLLTCNNTNPLTMYGDFSSAAQFYVFVGVMAFLYSLAAIILYVFAADKYHQNAALPAADLVITVIFVLLWLIASSAWADGVSKVKHYSHPDNLYVGEAPIYEYTHGFKNLTLEVTSGGSYASLNVSILFGFLNMVVWAGNIWFLYKETKWFGGNSDQSQHHGGVGTPDPQQRI